MLTHPNNSASHAVGTQQNSSKQAQLFSSQNWKSDWQSSDTRGKIYGYHVQIRNKELGQYKNHIRQEILRSNLIEDLLEQLPSDNESTCSWALELGNAFSGTFKYQFTVDKAVQIFKMAERFPNKLTLQLFEMVIVRADNRTIDMLFQYDVMRLLHGFINFVGKPPHCNNLQSSFSFEEAEIIKEVVITSAVEAVERNSIQRSNYNNNLQLARTTLRIISKLCRRSRHIRNFIVLNHKTYTYCLKTYNLFKEDIQIQFYMFLEAATFDKFGRSGQEQFMRITSKIMRIFFEEEMNIKIELLDEGQRSYLKSYQYIIKAVKNLLLMESQWICCKFFPERDSEEPSLITKVNSLISQCIYVMSYPTLDVNKENLVPIKLFFEIIDLTMHALEVSFKNIINCPGLINIYCQFVQFLRMKDFGMSSSDFICTRRSIYFMLHNFFCQDLDRHTFQSFICFNQTCPQDNLIALLSQYLELEIDKTNQEVMFEQMHTDVIEPLLISSNIFYIMMEKLVDTDYWREGDTSSTVETIKILIMNIIFSFFQYIGPTIGSQISYYKDLILSYSDKITAVVNSMSDSQLSRQVYQLLDFSIKEGY